MARGVLKGEYCVGSHLPNCRVRFLNDRDLSDRNGHIHWLYKSGDGEDDFVLRYKTDW